MTRRTAPLLICITQGVAVATSAGCGGSPSESRPNAAAPETGATASLQGNVLPADRERVGQYGMPDLVGEVGLNGIVRYMNPHKGLWPRSAETAHVFYYLDQKNTVYFSPGQPDRTQPLTNDQASFMRALAEGPRPVNR